MSRDTRRDLLRCLNEPNADPFFCGPVALSERHKVRGENTTADGFRDESRDSLVQGEDFAEGLPIVRTSRTVLNLLN